MTRNLTILWCFETTSLWSNVRKRRHPTTLRPTGLSLNTVWSEAWHQNKQLKRWAQLNSLVTWIGSSCINGIEDFRQDGKRVALKKDDRWSWIKIFFLPFPTLSGATGDSQLMKYQTLSVLANLPSRDNLQLNWRCRLCVRGRVFWRMRKCQAVSWTRLYFLAGIARTKNFLSKIITMNETWVHYYEPEGKQQSSVWETAHSPTPVKAEAVKSIGKVMLMVFMDNQGVILFHSVKPGSTVNSAYYSKVICFSNYWF